jgi:hypothetical protein
VLDPEVVLRVLDTIALLLFIALLGAGLFALLRRLRLYFVAGIPVPTPLRSAIVLGVALAVIGLEALGLAVLGAQPEDWALVAFRFQRDVIVLSAVFYWVKVELYDVDDPNKP